MGAVGSDKAFLAIMEWSSRDDWQADRERVVGDHLGPVCDALELSPDQIADVLGNAPFFQVMACVLEDFLTCEFEPDQRNVVDDYLKRRGWKESAPVKRYLKALKESAIGIYEVTGTAAGSHFFARDLVRGGAPVRVEDKLASASLVIWDRLAARLLVLGGKTYLSGGILPLSFADARSLLERIAMVRAAFTREVGREVRRLGVSRADLERLPIDHAILSEAAPAITQAWLLTVLRRALRKPRPGLTNSDGQPLTLCTIRIPVVESANATALAANLDAMPELARDAPRSVWIWLEVLPPASPTGLTACGSEEEDHPNERILGIVHLEPGMLRLEANSAERARRGSELLSQALGSLVGTPMPDEPAPELAFEADVPGPGQVELPLVAGHPDATRQQIMDAHYRGILGTPVPMLGGRSPKQAVRSKSGRRQAVEWLKHLENREGHRAQAQGEAAYDFGWLWVALGVAAERQ